MRHTRTERLNRQHLANVLDAKYRLQDIEDAKVITYMNRAVKQAEAQIQSLSVQATENVNKRFTQRFMEQL